MVRLPGFSDALRTAQSTAEAVIELPATVTALQRAVRSLAETVAGAGDTMARLNRLAIRLETTLDVVEEPVRALAPGITRLAVVLDDPVVDELPDTVRAIRGELLPLLAGLQATQARLAGLVSATDRVFGLGLPGSSLLRRPRREPDGPVDPPPQ